jgi:RNA polymerase primary sigma factor
MDNNQQLVSEIAPDNAALDHSRHDGSAVQMAKVDRAAADLFADFQRQRDCLKQAQFDRLVLRRNLSPSEMVALIAKLSSLGVTLNEDLPSPTNDVAARTLAPTKTRPTSKDSSINGTGNTARLRNPYALLSHRDEIELGRRVQLAIRIQETLDPTKVHSQEEKEIVQRGRIARDKMVLANLRLVWFAIKHMGRQVTFPDSWDLFQEGAIGLMRAVEKFDPELGLRFSTYALWWIRQAIFRGLDDGARTIRVPVHRLESIRRMRVVTRRLAYELNRGPSIREVSDALNWPTEKTLFIQRLTQLECIPLDAPIGNDGERTFADTMVSKEPGPFEITHEAQRADLLQGFLLRLTPRQQLVIERRFDLGSSMAPQTLQEVGDHLGVTRERVRQIEAVALRRLRYWVNQRMHDALL